MNQLLLMNVLTNHKYSSNRTTCLVPQDNTLVVIALLAQHY